MLCDGQLFTKILTEHLKTTFSLKEEFFAAALREGIKNSSISYGPVCNALSPPCKAKTVFFAANMLFSICIFKDAKWPKTCFHERKKALVQKDKYKISVFYENVMDTQMSQIFFSHIFNFPFQNILHLFLFFRKKHSYLDTDWSATYKCFLCLPFGKTLVNKSFFLCGRITKVVGRVNPLTTQQKKLFFFKIRMFQPKKKLT